MPLTEKGEEILHNMKEFYGPEKGESVFYASKNAGTITGVDTAGAQVPETDFGGRSAYQSFDITEGQKE